MADTPFQDILSDARVHLPDDIRDELIRQLAAADSPADVPCPRLLVELEGDSEAPCPDDLPAALAEAQPSRPIPGMGRFAELTPTVGQLAEILAHPAVVAVQLSGDLKPMTDADPDAADPPATETPIPPEESA